jgi:hypothetical protein
LKYFYNFYMNIKLSGNLYKMQTRSQTRKNQQDQAKRFAYQVNRPIYEVDIDFDYASECWKANKRYLGNGHYEYICECITKKGTNCKRSVKLGEHFCTIHNK